MDVYQYASLPFYATIRSIIPQFLRRTDMISLEKEMRAGYMAIHLASIIDTYLKES
jgi:hypothetical protein